MRLALLLSAAMLLPAPAPDPPVHLPVTIVVMDAFGDNRLAGAVRRTTGADAKDLVVVKRSSLTPELIVGLSKQLAAYVRRKGIVSAAPVNMYYMPDHRWPPASAAQLEWARGVIQRLQSAPKIQLGRLGSQVAITAVFDAE
jgi:hypothetical protein